LHYLAVPLRGALGHCGGVAPLCGAAPAALVRARLFLRRQHGQRGLALANAADEFIRLVSPVIYMRRTALQDAEIADQKIAAGEKVIMYYGAANRDPAIFDNPDQLDVARENANKHIAFGYGPHVCLGKRVAQIQLEEAYRQILGRFPDIEWTGEIDIAPNNFVHAIRRLGVRYAPRN
jgi:cytochrome P450